MQFPDAFRLEGPTIEVAVVDPLLDGNMGLSFELQVSLMRVGAKVVPECPFDIDRMGLVPLDQVAVVAVHRPHEIGERGHDAVRQALAESGSTLR